MTILATMIVHVLPFELFLGGGERLISNWLSRTKHESIFLCKRGNFFNDIPGIRYYSDYRELIYILNEIQNKVVIWHSAPEGPLIEAKPDVWYVHGAYAFVSDISRLPKPAMALSNYPPAWVHHSWADVPIRPVPLGVDLRKYSIRSYSSKSQDIIIGIIGRVSEEKIPMQWFDALKRFNNRYAKHNFRFHYYGAGGNNQYFKKFIKRASHIKNFRYCGFVPPAQSHTLYHRFDALMVTSTTETGSYAILEAQASGLQVFALNRDGIPYHVTSHARLSENYDDMFRQLMSFKYDNELKTMIIEETKKRFDVERQVRELDLSLEEVAHKAVAPVAEGV